MNLKQTTRLVAALLVLVGVGCMALRMRNREPMALDDGTTLWQLTYRATFNATHVGAKLQIAVPIDTPYARIYHEDLLYSGMSAAHLRSSRRLAREISLSAGGVGKHSLAARFDIHLSPKSQFPMKDPPLPKTPEERAAYTQAAPNLPVGDPQVAAVLAELKLAPGDTEGVKRIYEFCANGIQPIESTSSDPLAALRQRSGNALARTRVLVTLCRAIKQPARIVTGFAIDDQNASLTIEYWAEVLGPKGWIPYDPAEGFVGTMPRGYIPVRFDGAQIVGGTEMSALDSTFELKRLPPGPGALRYGRQKLSAILDLTRLPVEMHEPLVILLLMPLGALVTAIARTFVGVQTFGTFTPTLLALSFVYANWMTGLATFGLVLIIGLMSRTLLDRLKLLLVPRLGAMLTLVVLVITFNVSLLDYFNLTPSAQAVILPMVILTMTVERFYLTSEEESPAHATKLLLMTMAVGACCYLVLRWNWVGEHLLAYPEAHLLTIAVMMLLGRFSGYRLMELWRFRDLAMATETAA